MNKKIIVASFVVASGLVGLSAVPGVSAQSAQDAIKERVGQYSADRNEARTQRQAEHQAQREVRMSQLPSQLDEAVSEGVLTAEQKDLLLQKHEEMQSSRQQWQEEKMSMSPEERRAAATEKREEMKAWAEANNIPSEFVARNQKAPADHSFGGGNGMRWNQNR